MVTIGMNYRVLPGKEESFEKAFRGVLAVMRQGGGHAATQLYRDIDDPQSYLIVSDWEDEEAYQRFVRSEQFAAVTNWGAEQILAGRPRHTVYRT